MRLKAIWSSNVGTVTFEATSAIDGIYIHFNDYVPQGSMITLYDDHGVEFKKVVTDKDYEDFVWKIGK